MAAARFTLRRALLPRIALPASIRASWMSNAASGAGSASGAAGAQPSAGAVVVAKHTVQSKLPLPATDPSRLFAVVSLGGHQFKVTPGDLVVVDKLKGAEVGKPFPINDVLLVGSRSTTVVGRPTVPNATVMAMVEQQKMDEKVVVYHKRRRKHSARTHGFRRELTLLRVGDIQVPEQLLA